jgi:uncharacterized membrane protein
MTAGSRNHLLWLWFLFSIVCFSVGGATLNRYDPSRTEGVGDSEYYFRMAHFDYSEVLAPYRFRVLTPTLAGLLVPVLSRLPLHSWNITSLSLLMVNSLFVSLSALLLFQMARRIGGSGVTALVASFLYLTSFPIPNGHLAGLVDAGEGFVLLALLRIVLYSPVWWCVPTLALGATAKESAFLFGSVILVTTWLATRKGDRSERRITLPVVATSLAAGIVVLLLVRNMVGGSAYSLHSFSTARLSGLGEEFLACLKSRSVIYTFLFLVPFGVMGLKWIPRPLLAASAAAGVAAYLAGAYAGITENVARPLFNTVGQALSIGSALALERLVVRSEGEGAR